MHLQSTGLATYLHNRVLTDIYIAGLATDYCVKFTALDAVNLGFNTWVIQDACRGVDVSPGDVDKAFAEMKQAGCQLIHSELILN
jgi:nicotinamidase/pyrazinamidase